MNLTETSELECDEEILNSADFIEKNALKKTPWTQVKNEYITYYLQQLRTTTKLDTTIGVDITTGVLIDNNNEKNDADMLYEALAVSFANISPITEAIKNDNKPLFDCIMKYYAQDAVQDQKVLKYAVEADDRSYLKKIAETLSQNGHSQDSLREIFGILLRSKHADVAQRMEMILDIFPDAKTYQNAEGKNLLMMATQAHNKDICHVLTDKGFDPLYNSDQHCVNTIYGYAYEQSLEHPKNKSLQVIVNDFKQKIDDSHSNYRQWIEERAKTRIKNHKSDVRVAISISSTIVGLISLLALYKCQYEKTDSQSLPHNEPQKVLSAPDAEMPKSVQMNKQNQLTR